MFVCIEGMSRKLRAAIPSAGGQEASVQFDERKKSWLL